MRTEQEVRERLQRLKKETKSEGPFTQFENIARVATQQALKWILEETDNLLTY